MSSNDFYKITLNDMDNRLLILILFFSLYESVVASNGRSALTWKNYKPEQYNKAYLKQILTPVQYQVTQENGTELPFENAYHDIKEDGIFVDIVSGEPLFSSRDKFDSKTGWPSFTKAISNEAVVIHKDFKLIFPRTEVRSKLANSHLGHVFDDGPLPDKKRYCMNSAALKFIPKKDLAKNGYGEYISLFTPSIRPEIKTAILAGGCFWGMEFYFKKLKGVVNTQVGNTGGLIAHPTYEQIKKGNTGHAEALKVEYDNTQITYPEILEYFFKIHDPTTLNKQGNDVGNQYRSSIFVNNDQEQETAKEIIKKVEDRKFYKGKIVTEIVRQGKFYKAEDYHQDYLDKFPDGYNCHYQRY